jgi:hypothetical protein
MPTLNGGRLANTVGAELQRLPQFSPHIGAAIRADRPWLRLYCAGCQQTYQIDLRRVVRPLDFPITALRAAMVCDSMCRGQDPQPELLGLDRHPFDYRRQTARDDRA